MTVSEIDAKITELQKLRAKVSKPRLYWVSRNQHNPSKELGSACSRGVIDSDGKYYTSSEAHEFWAYYNPLTREEWLELEPEAISGYKWGSIVAKYPTARYVTTDKDGMVCIWDVKPACTEPSARRACWANLDSYWLNYGDHTKYFSGYSSVEWEDSLEMRPEGL